MSNEKPPIFPVLEHYGLEATDPVSGRAKVLCPFHDESRPSASVDVDKQRFRCFACDIQGDAIDIIMQQEGLEYTGACEFLEAHFGIERSTVSRKSDARPLRSSLFVADRGKRVKRGDANRVSGRRRRPRLR